MVDLNDTSKLVEALLGWREAKASLDRNGLDPSYSSRKVAKISVDLNLTYSNKVGNTL